MSIRLLLQQHAKRVGHNPDSFPYILNLDSEDGNLLWSKFLATQPAKDIKTLYRDLSDQYLSLLFVNYLMNLKSNPFKQGKIYHPQSLSLKMLIAVMKTVNTRLNTLFHRKRLLQFSPANRQVHLDSNFSKFLNAFSVPNVVIFQNLVLKRGNFETALSSLRGYLYKDFPTQLIKPDRAIKIESLHKHNKMQWFYIGSADGISVSIRRIDDQVLNLRISFDIPFVLPLGNLNKQTFHNLIVRSLNSFNAGF